MLAAYYAVVAGKMLPHIQDGPLSLGARYRGRPATDFFQKHRLPGMPRPHPPRSPVAITILDG
ncbi:non-homologous end-joining DNA ligase LigD [Mesorhizobium sp. 43Arga]